MTYSQRELSVDSAKPVELFHFYFSGKEWFYTNADTPIIQGVRTYTPTSITRGKITSQGDVNKATLEIVSVSDLPVGLLFSQYPPSEPVLVTVYGHHILDDEFAVIWKGRILSAEWDDMQQVTLRSESVFTSLQRPGLGRTFQAQCPYALYGSQCGVSNVAFQERAVVTAINGRVVTANTAKPLNHYAGGYATWGNAVIGANEKRGIKSSTATGVITLSTYPVGLKVGDTIDLYAGCDHTLNGDNGCTKKFNNHIRFGGTPWQPEKNPFDGSTIY